MRYLPIDGIAAYDQAVQKLLSGNDSPLISRSRPIRPSAVPGALKIGALTSSNCCRTPSAT